MLYSFEILTFSIDPAPFGIHADLVAGLSQRWSWLGRFPQSSIQTSIKLKSPVKSAREIDLARVSDRICQPGGDFSELS